MMERTNFILEETADTRNLNMDSLVGYLQIVGEKGEEMLKDFIINYMILINGDSKGYSSLHVDGRLINKTIFSVFYDLGIIFPFNLGSDPVYDPFLFQKLKDFYNDCGFHPGKKFTRNIVIRYKGKLELLKKLTIRVEDDVDTFLRLYCGKANGVDGLKELIHNLSSLKRKSERDQFAQNVDRELIRELLDCMKLDYVNHRILEKVPEISPNTRNIIEEIDLIINPTALGEVRPGYEDRANLEKKIKDAFKNYRRLPLSRIRDLKVGKNLHMPSCQMNNGEYDYLLNHEFLEAVREQDGETPRIITYEQKKYLVFRGTWKRSFLGTRWNPREEHKFSHIHYYFLEIEEESLDEIETIANKLEKCLHGIVAKRFFIKDCIKEQLETGEKLALEDKYYKYYELLKEKNDWPQEMNIEPPEFDPIPKYGGLILATLSISAKHNIPLSREFIQSYLKKIEIETLLSLGDEEVIRAFSCFKNGSISFKSLYAVLKQQYAEDKSIMERLRYLGLMLTKLLPAGYISQNTRPLKLITLFDERKSLCEGYVLILGFLFHLWQDIFPELLGADIRLYLIPYRVLNDVIEGTEFRESHTFITIRIDGELYVIDPTKRISDKTVKRNEGLEDLLRKEGYWRSYRIMRIEEMHHG